MQLSVRACLLNLLPFLLYGVIMFGLLARGDCPLFAGLVLWLPLARDQRLHQLSGYLQRTATQFTGLTGFEQDLQDEGAYWCIADQCRAGSLRPLEN